MGGVGFMTHVAQQRTSLEPAPAATGRALCHDLKQPVAAIMMLASEPARLSDGQLSAGARDRFRQIASEIAVLGEMIDAVLDPSPSVPTIHEVDPATDLDAEVASVVTVARRTAPGYVAFAPGAPHARVRASRAVVHRVVANVVDNAIRASGPGGTVRVTSRLLRGRAVVSVVDEGPGWGLVEPGHGLGLVYVEEVLRSVGGTFSARRLPSARTRVRLELPLSTTSG